MGKTRLMAGRGEKAPERIFMDRDGTLTNDPGVVKEGGTILFTGGEHHGHKGYGLSLWCEALTAAGGGECNNPRSRHAAELHPAGDRPRGARRPRALPRRDRALRAPRQVQPPPARRRLDPPAGRAGVRGAAPRPKADGVNVEEAMLAKLDDLAAKAGIASARAR